MTRTSLLSRNRRRNLPAYRTLGCPHSKDRTLWCHRVCKPRNGIGTCGRLAPHAMKSRLQRAIARQKRLQAS